MDSRGKGRHGRPGGERVERWREKGGSDDYGSKLESGL